jgi:hypothetical protein
MHAAQPALYQIFQQHSDGTTTGFTHDIPQKQELHCA